MKTLVTLAAAAALAISAGAHAAEPLKLNDAALDSVTAGSFFAVGASTFGASASFLGANPALGSGSTTESSYAFGQLKMSPTSKTVTLYGAASGRSTAAGPGEASASGGGLVTLGVFNNGLMIAQQ